MKAKTLTAKLLFSVLLAIAVLAGGLVFVMNYFMYSLTDTIMLSMLRPMAKTAAQSVESNLHTLADRFFLIRDNSVLASLHATIHEKRAVLDNATSGIEFVWLGVYEPDGALLTGSGDCPFSISGRALFPMIRETANLVIEDTSVGNSGLEIVMGVPVTGSGLDGSKTGTGPAYYLVGSYRYDVLSDVLNNINIGTHGTAFIITETGAVIAHKDLGKVFSQESITETWGDGRTARDVLRSMGQGRTGSADIRTAGGQVFVSYAPIHGTRWSLGIQAPRSDFMSPARQALLISGIITFVSLLFFAGVIGISARRILSLPLAAITDDARKLSMGTFEGTVSRSLANRDDEIGQLGIAFASMASAIKGVIHDIGQLTRAVRAGALDARADFTRYQGDYHLILAGINATLDTVCSHLDAMPGAMMMLNERRDPLYCNRAMRGVLALHGLAAETDAFSAFINGNGGVEAISPLAAALFDPHAGEADTYKAHVTLPATDGMDRNYTLSMRRVGNDGHAHGAADMDALCVMLILDDVTLLTKAKTDAEAASRAKGDFLSRMSHEMRTPMNAIIGMAAIGRAAEDIERKEYCLGKISEASQHLLGVINDILDMSKIEADKFELSCGEFNFEKMLQRVTNVINFRMAEKDQDLFIEMDRDIPVNLISDEQRLAQVITNLLSNAVKFTPEKGSVILKAEKIAETDETCTLRIAVRDTGIGISEEQQKRLFVSFEQADGSISRKFGGTGLGLAISKRIIEKMDGRIWIESELGKGAAFIFEISAPKGREETRQMPPADIDWKKLRVLVVDDSPVITGLFRSLLSHHGATCEVAASGREAVAIVEENKTAPFDMVFVDSRVPDMDAMELARTVTAGNGSIAHMVLMTAADWSEMERDAREAGFSAFLQKPLFPSVIIECITANLGKERNVNAVAAEIATEDDIFAGRRILLAEDVAINREIIAALIEHTGVTMDFAMDGEQAVEKYSAAPASYDLILMDVHMPNCDGYEATRRIRASGLPGAAIIPIVAMTANVFREDVERCLDCGMNSHLGKPIDAGEVIATLKRYLVP